MKNGLLQLIRFNSSPSLSFGGVYSFPGCSGFKSALPILPAALICRFPLLACHTNYYTVKVRANRGNLQISAAGRIGRADF
jgi:hypothetical protein